jgi:hypothetical protein
MQYAARQKNRRKEHRYEEIPPSTTRVAPTDQIARTKTRVSFKSEKLSFTNYMSYARCWPLADHRSAAGVVSF